MEKVTCELGENGVTLPLFIRPKNGQDSAEFLIQWVGENKELLKQKILEYGAVMFRGFKVSKGIEFERAVKQVEPELCKDYRGTSPRKLVPGTEYVFTASEMPPFFPIPQHLEMSFLSSPPRNIYFCCLDEPVGPGGETALCDFKKVYDDMDLSVRKKFENKGVMVIRNYHEAGCSLLSDPTQLKGWPEVFDTDKKEDVEEECRNNYQDFTWKKNGGLRLVNKRNAFENHPVTGDRVWFNHLQVFHWYMIPDEFSRIYKRLGSLKYLLLSWLTWFMKLFFLNVVGPMNCGLHTCYGDGTEITNAENKHIRDVTWNNMIFNRWQQGDLIMIDNYRISHGRQPYSGKRLIVVSWSKPYLRPSLREKVE